MCVVVAMACPCYISPMQEGMIEVMEPQKATG